MSAERSAIVRERGRQLVLRGTSPSARLMAHRDVMQPSPPEILRDDVVPGHDMTTPHPPNAGAAWTMPPIASGMGGGYMTGMAGDGVRHVRGYDAAKLRDSIKGTSGFADV